MKKIETEIKIEGSIEDVWSVLTDFEEYPNWNPFIKELHGKLNVGERLVVVFEKMTFKPTVTSYEPTLGFSWLGHLYISGLFDGEHSFKLVDNKDGSVTLLHGEIFKGLLVPFFGKMLEKTKSDFIQMNQALKDRVEVGVFL